MCVGPTRAPTVRTVPCLTKARLMCSMVSVKLCQDASLQSGVSLSVLHSARNIQTIPANRFPPCLGPYSQLRCPNLLYDQPQYGSVAPEHQNIPFNQPSAHAPELENESLLRQTIGPFPEGAATSVSKASSQHER